MFIDALLRSGPFFPFDFPTGYRHRSYPNEYELLRKMSILILSSDTNRETLEFRRNLLYPIHAIRRNVTTSILWH